jgi:hypothetical protein
LLRERKSKGIKWKQPSLNRDDWSNHVVVHVSHLEQRREPQSVSLIERDTEVIPDIDIAAKVGRYFFLHQEKTAIFFIPKKV